MHPCVTSLRQLASEYKYECASERGEKGGCFIILHKAQRTQHHAVVRSGDAERLHHTKGRKALERRVTEAKQSHNPWERKKGVGGRPKGGRRPIGKGAMEPPPYNSEPQFTTRGLQPIADDNRGHKMLCQSKASVRFEPGCRVHPYARH